jgi:hypothetical protein
MSSIPGFSDSELHHVRGMLTQQVKKDVEIQLSNCGLTLAKNPGQPILCPTVHWNANGANFIVYKTGDSCYKTQFFYTPHEQYGPHAEEYNNLCECVATVMQAQSEHVRISQDGEVKNPGKVSS